MEILLTIALLAGIFLILEVLLVRPSWRRWVVDRLTRQDPGDAERPAGDGPGGADPLTVEWSLFSRSFIRGRLDALTQELDRLDRDPEIFAKAFHTMVARSAYEALLADASRLCDPPRARRGQTLDFEFVGRSTGLREELEL